MNMNELEREFYREMLKIYRRALVETGYNATRFLQMLQSYGGVETAKKLLSSKISEGYIALWERGRLDLTVEALILNEKWNPLFSDHEREVARERLMAFGYIG